MYETEVNHTIESGTEIPAEVIRALSELKGRILARTVLPWSEHCTECAWPTCYSTCDLYSPRRDGKCRRFVDGMVRVTCPTAINSYLLKIKFKRWGKLWSPGSVLLRSTADAEEVERRDFRIGTVLYQLPVPSGIKSIVTGKRYSFKKRRARRSPVTSDLPTSFLVECYNPESYTIRISLAMRSSGEEVKMQYQKLIELAPGFHRVRVPMGEIGKVLDVASPFHIDLIPNEVQDGTTLYFGLMEFVREVGQLRDETKKIKCVIWDLDHTVWEGILAEDGPRNLKLKPKIVDVLRALTRGILNSVASKNNDHNDAMQALKWFASMNTFFVRRSRGGRRAKALRQ